MARHFHVFRDRESWLAGRQESTGGSEIAAVIGISPWISNTGLWEIKTGRREPKDMSGSELVQYGTKAEEHIRNLFALDFPEYRVMYVPDNMWTNDTIPHGHASLDLWMSDSRDRFGVGEIKTVTPQNRAAWEKWDGRIPGYYHAQLLWEMAITEADFGVLIAQFKREWDGDLIKTTRHYFLERDESVDRDIAYLIEENRKFWQAVEEDKAPPAKLPEI